VSTISAGDDFMNENNNIPVPDPFSKDYEYFFPSASWDKSGIIPVTAEDNYNIIPNIQNIDIKIPEQ